MPETMQNRFTEALIRNSGRGHADDQDRSFTSERQHAAQAFNLHVERRDGRQKEGFAWAHYLGYQWTDEGSHERLVLMFGARAVEIDGHNLGVLVDEIREGKLNGIKELSGAQALSLQQANPDNQPIITSVRSYPDFDVLMRDLRGGEDDHETRHAGSSRGR
jgi:hypothetical protein